MKDNAGLFHALNENNKVLPIFIYDKNTLDKLNKSDHRLDFIEDSLKKLNDLLKKNDKSISIRAVSRRIKRKSSRIIPRKFSKTDGRRARSAN